MEKKICVYTCITGNYDNLHEIEKPEEGIDYYCFTNNKNLKSKTWRIVQIKNDGLDNHHLSRKIKMLGHPIISKNYDISIWMDASIVWQNSIKKFVSLYFKNTTFAAFKHHARTSVKEEAVTCLLFRKDTKESILNTLSFLDSQKYPYNTGLFEMTVFIKKHNDSLVEETMKVWYETNLKYSKRDQLSFPYAIWKTGLKISIIDLNVWDNTWFYSIKHINHSNIDCCHVYYGDISKKFDFNKFFIYSYNKNGEIYSFETKIPYDTNVIEFYPTDIATTQYSNIILKPAPTQTTIYGDITYGNKSIFCTSHGTIKARGVFQKNQKLSFSINMSIMEQSNIDTLVEQLWIQKNEATANNSLLKSQNQTLQKSNHELQKQLNDVLNSKGWKMLEKIRKAFHL